MLPRRKKIMIETRKLIQHEYRVFRTYNQLTPDIEERIFPLLTKRINDLGIRSFFTRTIYHYIIEQAGMNDEVINAPSKQERIVFEKKMPFVAEVIIAIQYYQNQILDGKGGLKSGQEHLIKEKVDQNLIASHYIKDALYEYIDREIYPNDPTKNRLVTRAVRRIFRYVDLGQDMQDQWGTVEKFQSLDKYISINPEIDQFIDKEVICLCWDAICKNGIAVKHEWFVKNYLLRIQLTSAALFTIMSELVMDLLNYKNETKRSEIIRFSNFQGTLGQIVNDNNDYVLPEYNISTMSKIPEDAFADLRNNIITLPLIYHIHKTENPAKTIKKLQDSLNRKPETNIVQTTPQWAFFKFSPFMNIINTFIPDNNQGKLHLTLRALLPSIYASIHTAERINISIKGSNLIKKSEFGDLINDMGSIAEVRNNRFYQKIYTKLSIILEERKDPIKEKEMKVCCSENNSYVNTQPKYNIESYLIRMLSILKLVPNNKILKY
jgi:hypothetical protein